MNKIQKLNTIYFIKFFMIMAGLYIQIITAIAAEINIPMQNIRGIVLDTDSKSPIVGATVIILQTNPLIGTVTNYDGNFKIENIPVGRIYLQISSMGYEDRIVSNVMIESGKETVLTVELTESLVQLDEVVVTSRKNKSEALNEMALISTRAFSIEETKRFAGSLNDPARMVSSYAGVANDPHGNNFIVVRGNASKGVQWRLEGIEIPNPNHFANEGETGGPISALNSDMLSNSDFHTGAFAADYGNAYSGIFDMRLRTGNNEKKEYSIGVGVLGTDIALEGPFGNNIPASYLFNYRYSSLAMLDGAGIVDFDGVPKYSDMTLKIHVPTKKMGTFSLFGLGGKSGIEESYKSEEDESYIIADGTYNSGMGVLGLNHTYFLNDNLFLKTSISVSDNFSNYDGRARDSLDLLLPSYKEDLNKYIKQGGVTANWKANSQNLVRCGINYSLHSYQFKSKEILDDKTWLDNSDKLNMANSFISWKYRMNENITLVSGVHGVYSGLNNEISIEPRFAFQYQINPKQSVNFGFGVHSRLEPLPIYFVKVDQPNGESVAVNRNLKMPKARHYVVGYNYMVTKNVNLKLEAYYQDLYQIGVSTSDSTFSMVNMEWWVPEEKMVNKGTGRNMGIEVTLERYFTTNYYYMVTASIYDSKYRGIDGVLRNTTFNGNYTANILGGKEFIMGKPSKNRTMGMSARATLVGGRRITPIDETQSLQEKKSIYLSGDDTYSFKSDDIFSLNIAVYVRRNFERVSHEFKLDISNVTNQQTKIYPYFDDALNNGQGGIEYSQQMGIMPNIMYRLYF